VLNGNGHWQRGICLDGERTIVSMYAAPGPQPGVNFFLCLEVRLLMIEALKQKLGEEVEKLQFELNVTLPGEIRRAVEMGDLRENSEYKAALERQQFVRARLSQLRERLSKLSSIDVTQIARDAVGLGSTVHVADEKTGLEETYQLVFGDAIEYEDGQVTMSSPIGRALLGKKVGEVTFLRLPTVTRQLKVKELKTIHDLTPGDVTEG
jgi:transcription elongation factor GreA